MSLISVIIPVYNVEKEIERCLKSICEQTFRDLEIILVDDGSPDRCPQICDEYAQKDNRIVVIHKTNGGLGSARNAGMKVATGQYISFIDGDDWLEKDTYMQLNQNIEDYNPDVIRFGYKKMYQGRELEKVNLFYKEGYYNAADQIKEMRLDSICHYGMLDYSNTRILSACMNLYRKEFIDRHGLIFLSERTILNEDYLFVTQVINLAENLYINKNVYYYYETRVNSLTTVYRTDMYSRKQNLFKEYENFLDMSDPDIQTRMLNFYVDCIYDCMINECNKSKSNAAGINEIRKLLNDEKLQYCIKKNAEYIVTRKSSIICFLIKNKMAFSFYWLYKLVRKAVKNRYRYGKYCN